MIIAVLCATPCALRAQETLQDILPLLQKQTKTAAETANITNVFIDSRDVNLTFASGAALVQNPPPAENITRFLNLLISSQDGLKRVFASVILVAMDQRLVELLPMLEEAALSQDPMIKAYASSAAARLAPAKTIYSDDVFALYPFSKNFSLAALNAMYKTDKKLLSAAKKAAQAKNPLSRAGAAEVLGDFGSEKEQKTLFKMLKKEDNVLASSAIARAIARRPAAAVQEAKKCLNAPSESISAKNCSLTIGFMTDKGLPLIKEALTSPNAPARANAARAAAVMANVLSDENASSYSTDVDFDKKALRALLPVIAQMSEDDTAPAARTQASAALKEFSKILK